MKALLLLALLPLSGCYVVPAGGYGYAPPPPQVAYPAYPAYYAPAPAYYAAPSFSFGYYGGGHRRWR